jgi:hypothetical protein
MQNNEVFYPQILKVEYIMREPYLKNDYRQIVFAIKRPTRANKQNNRTKVLPKVFGSAKMFKENDSSKPKNHKMNISESETSIPTLGEFEPIIRLSKGPKMIGNARITTRLTNQLSTHTFVIGLRVEPSGQFTTCIFIVTDENDTKEEVFSITGECFIASIAASATGKHVTAVSSKGVLYKTENYGQPGSWTIDEQLKGHNCKQVVINSEGQYVLVLTTNKLYLSNNYGQTFSKALELDDTKAWFTSVSLDEASIDIDIDKPMKISIQTNTSQIYLSEDMGATFIANA